MNGQFPGVFPPPGTRDYIPCNLCGRSIEMSELQGQQGGAQQHTLGNQGYLQNTPACKVCQSRMQGRQGVSS